MRGAFRPVFGLFSDIGHVPAAAMFKQQTPAYEIRRPVAKAIVSVDEATRLKFGVCEEIAHLLKGRSVLKHDAHRGAMRAMRIFWVV